MERLFRFIFGKNQTAERRPIFFSPPPTGPEVGQTEEPENQEAQQNEMDDLHLKPENVGDVAQDKVDDTEAALKKRKERTDEAGEGEKPADQNADKSNEQKSELDPKQQNVVNKLTALGLSPDAAATIVKGLAALGALLKQLQGGGEGAADNKAPTDAKEGNKGGEAKTDTQTDKTPEATAESPDDVKKVQNPKAEAEKIATVDVAALEAQKTELETKGADANADGKTNLEEAQALVKQLEAIQKQITEAEKTNARKEALENEQERRNQMVDDAWAEASKGIDPESRAVQNISLDGDQLNVEVKPGLEKGAQELLAQLGIDAKLNGTAVSITAHPDLFKGDKVDPVLQTAFDAVAKLPAAGAAENKEEGEKSIEAKVQELNDKIDSIRDNCEEEVLLNTRIGRALAVMDFSFNAETNNIDISLPPDLKDDVIALAGAVGWETNEDGSSMSRGKDGEIALDGASIVVPAYLGFAGKEGDADSQHAEVAKSLNLWEGRLSGEVSADTQELGAAEGDPEIVVKDETGEYIASLADSKFAEDMQRIKDNLAPGMEKTVMGRALQNVDFKQDADGKTVIVFDGALKPKEFAFIFRSTFPKGIVEEVGKSGGDNYVKLNGADVSGYLRRIEAMVSNPQEAGEGEGEEGAEEVPEDTERSEEIPAAKDALPGQIRQDKEGSYWQKNAEGMWESYNNRDAGMNSDSGYRKTQWGDGQMQDNTEKIVEENA